MSLIRKLRPYEPDSIARVFLWFLRASICTDCGVITTKGGSYKKGEFTCLRCFTETRRIQQNREVSQRL